MAAQVEIERLVIRFTTTLEIQKDSRTVESLVQLFDHDLDQIRTAFEDVWTEEIDMNLQTAKLYLYSMCFLSRDGQGAGTGSSTSEAQNPPPSPTVLQLGLAAAVRLTHTFRNLRSQRHPMTPPDSSHLQEEDDVGHLEWYPKHTWRAVAFATIFLLRYIAAVSHAPDSDRELARNQVSEMHRLFMQFNHSVEHIETARTMEILGRMPLKALAGVNKYVNHRGGASIVYESSWQSVMQRKRHQNRRQNLAQLQPSTGANQSAQESHSADHSSSSHVSPGAENVPRTESLSTKDSSAMIHPGDTLQEMNLGYDLPWGVWDDAVYDTLIVDADMGQGNHDVEMEYTV